LLALLLLALLVILAALLHLLALLLLALASLFFLLLLGLVASLLCLLPATLTAAPIGGRGRRQAQAQSADGNRRCKNELYRTSFMHHLVPPLAARLILAASDATLIPAG
ncbi:MAG TPA: hypothetical protein PKA57_07210, partial [Parvibaculum sp.]|uniref:hypothetical protein n=1 Tax=Parvibaculum sp. TaxID=2024848 RepID=UPI002C1F3818